MPRSLYIYFVASFQSVLIKQCQCHEMSIFDSIKMEGGFDYTNVRTCVTYDDILCLYRQFRIFMNQDVNQCAKVCPLECDSIIYKLSRASSSYPTEMYLSFLKNHPTILQSYGYNSSKISLDSLKSKVLILSVYYQEMGYERMVEYVKFKFVGKSPHNSKIVRF